MRRADLYLQIHGRDLRVGTLTVLGRDDRATTDFWYDPAFMYGDEGFDLAPSLRRTDEALGERGIPLFLQDAGPDRWGAHLLRREAKARQHRYLDEFDFILGANDHSRQGALRFADQDTGGWLSGTGVPAHIALVDLLKAADDVAADSESLAPFAKLLETGTSALGGARPKASVMDERGGLLMAKFPMPTERRNVPAWEKTALDLAHAAGLAVPHTRLEPVLGRDVLLLERFDRDENGRIPYLSFRTLLNNPDDGRRTPDYLQIANALRQHTDADMSDLFRRAAFTVLINNTDDHLRNMGLLRSGGGWRPAPVFDINPEPEAGRERHTGIAGRHGLVGIGEALIHLGRACGLGATESRGLVDTLTDSLAGWQRVAESNGIGQREIVELDAALTAVHTQVLAGLRPTRARRSGPKGPRTHPTTPHATGASAPRVKEEEPGSGH